MSAFTNFTEEYGPNGISMLQGYVQTLKKRSSSLTESTELNMHSLKQESRKGIDFGSVLPISLAIVSILLVIGIIILGIKVTYIRKRHILYIAKELKDPDTSKILVYQKVDNDLYTPDDLKQFVFQ